jgi:5'-nucleotidase / UDP-sugar diphosphatase
MNERLLCLLAALVLPLTATACIDRPDAANLDGQDVEIVFIHSSDIHSRLVPYELDVGETDQTIGLLPTNAPFGGMARLSAVVRQERRDNERFAYVETGDVFQGAPIFNSYSGEPELRAMTNMGVDVFTIGNHEFDNGPTTMVEKAKQFANFPILSANYLTDDWHLTGNAATGSLLQPYAILNLKGIKVGVIGLGDLGAMRSIFKGGNSLGITPLQTKRVLQQWVDFLRPQVDLVVVASHTGYQDDLDYIPRVEGLDIVFGGHLHITLNPPNVLQDCDVAKLRREKDKYICDTPDKLRDARKACEAKNTCCDTCGDDPATFNDCQLSCQQEALDGCNELKKAARYADRLKELDEDIAFLEKRGCHPRNVLLVHSGAFLKFIGKLQVTIRQCSRLEQREVCVESDAAGNCLNKVPRRCVGRSDGRNDWEVIASTYKLIPVDKTLPEDPKMLFLLEPYLIEFSRMNLLTQVVGFSSQRLKRFSSGSGDSQVGNLVADSMQVRNQVWADFAVTNSLGIRSDIVPGAIDEEMLTNVFPFENTLTVMYLSGFEVQELMDFITQRSTNRGCQSQAQVAGLTATLNCGGCPGDGGNTCIRQPYNGAACAQRVTVGGSGRACLADKDCERDDKGKLTGEICSGQRHPKPDPKAFPAGARRCWLPISCFRSYRLATNDYIAKGGSGFQVLERNTTQKNLGISLRAGTKDYLLTMPTCAQKPDPASFGIRSASLITGDEVTLLRVMEQKALAGDAAGASADFKTLRDAISKRQLSPTGADDAEKKLVQSGLANYLACTDDYCPQTDPSKCIGLAAQQVKACTDYRFRDIARCEALGRVRAALRCLTLPCIIAQEDGRQQRIFKDSSGSPAPDEPWPE